MDEAGYAQTLDAVYEAAVAPERWPALLQRLRDGFDAGFACTMLRTEDRSDYRAVAVGLDDDEYQAFLRRWSRRNVFAQRQPTGDPGEVISTHDIISRPELERSEMYADFLGRHDMHEGMRFSLLKTDGIVQDISVMRPFTASGFAGDELARGRALVGHLRRMAEVQRHLRGTTLAQQAAFAALDALRQAVVVVDAQSRVVHANRAAEALLRRRDGLVTTGGALAAALPSAADRLGALLGRALGADASAGAIRLPRPDGGTPLALVAMPVSPAGRETMAWAAPGGRLAIVCVADPDHAEAPTERLLSELFGLTQAETRLAAALLAGETLNDVASRTSRSVHTLRGLLARLMAKTDTGRQSDLIRTLAQLPRTEI